MAPARTSKRESKRTSPKPFETEEPATCLDCGTILTHKTDLPRHMNTHEPLAFRYYCEESGCDFSCLQKSALEPHGNTHSKKKTKHCPDCTKSFADGSSLTNHRKREHGHQPHHTKAYLEIKGIKDGKKSASKKGASKATSSTATRAERRDERRATPYGVPAPAARSAARAKKAAKESSSALADAGLFYAPFNDAFSSSTLSDLSELLCTLPPLSPSSDAPSLTYSSSSSTSSPATPREFSPSSSSSWNDDFDVTMLDSPMPQGPPFLVEDPIFGYEVGATDCDWASFVQQELNNCYGMNSSAPIPAQNWAGADVYSQALYNAVQAASVPEANFYPAMFQDAPVSYNGIVSQSMDYALPSMPELGFNATYDQYAPVQVEQLQPAASQALSELAAQMNVSEQQVALWLAEMDQATPEFYTQ
ncbi:hypothetical protein EWM64_g4939 [Hericium alpestre]|uniref:C2H2-type domain-containing protein n=1 Tax=Hericium alpestre TaxID=135208 RepID=A0A4Y9ZYG0_9AGAM|nr:hypothetical protein EWM64_g4939 [Hericium alpestre]